MGEYKPDYDPVLESDISILSVAMNDYDAYCESTEASAVFNWLYDYALNADKRIAELEAEKERRGNLLEDVVNEVADTEKYFYTPNGAGNLVYTEPSPAEMVRQAIRIASRAQEDSDHG